VRKKRRMPRASRLIDTFSEEADCYRLNLKGRRKGLSLKWSDSRGNITLTRKDLGWHNGKKKTFTSKKKEEEENINAYHGNLLAK